MGRGDGRGEPKQDTGRMGFRWPGEPPDERPMIAVDACRCKACVEDRKHKTVLEAVYETAVQSNPRRPDEGPMAYVERISGLVSDDSAVNQLTKRMPRPGLSRKAQDLRLMLLRNQAKEGE